MLLEEFISDDPVRFIETLKRTQNVSSVCGRVFKVGEPTYSCRECSMDATCVLCSSCFKKSTHRLHKYKMATSGGGGCCDCGDHEAWKKDPVCEGHGQSNSDQGESQQQTAPLPESVQGRCRFVFRAILNYCMRVLQMHSDGNLVELDDEENSHCTILYNDETHTFEQVIQTLTSIVKCSQKEAVDYVTSIDREGRAVVKCAPFEVCRKLKEDIETKAIRSSMGMKPSPLKVTVLHRNEVACQHLAMQILGWMQEFLSLHSTFRNIFAALVCETSTACNLKIIMSNDHNLWKSARTCWHRLLISGMLMEYENKKNLAVVFTRHYGPLMQDFIRDDHYHSFSIVSLSVQLFTVPTIAHHLIAHESAFFKLMHTFYAESIEKHIKNRQLQFAKNTSSMNVFKRSAYILIDLKYLLSFRPEEGMWTQELRAGFLHGVQILIRLLKCMQGMDAVTRQVGQHMEYEPEWETAFTLHLKLSHLITLVLEWCATDRIVLVKVYRMLLTALTDVKFIVHEMTVVTREVANHGASCLTYDVSSRPVSVHLPLTRFLAGLYLEIERYGLTYDSIAPNCPERPTPERIIEPVLCTRTMISQVYAGMWRRNGYALLNQIYFYRNVKCRYEMLDRDIVILQIGASLIEANEFLIHVLNKFKLLHWLENDQPVAPRRLAEAAMVEEDYVRQTVNLVDEFLELLIAIVGERYVSGVGAVTENDRIKKEIVQQLCIKPHLHSELNRALNEDKYSETAIEAVIEDVAVFERPTATGKKGVYRLKPEYYSWYNLYFYHYTKEDKSKSEETQRNRCKERNELVCCPPPALPKLTEPFSIIPNILQCDVMLEIMNVVLIRALDLKAISFSEGQLQRLLHLIGYAIQEEETGHYPYLKFCERSQKINLLWMLEELAMSQRVESQRDLLRWVIQRYKALETKNKTLQMESIKEEVELGQNAEQVEKEQRAKLAAKRRAEILAQMHHAQISFINANAAMFEHEEALADASVEEDMDWVPSASGSASSSSCTTATGRAVTEQNIQRQPPNAAAAAATTAAEAASPTEPTPAPSTPVCMGPGRADVRSTEGAVSHRYTCILCSEESVLSARNTTCMVYAAFVQRSSVLSRYQQTNEEGQLQYIETDIHPSPHISTCGHVMHADCFEQYFNNEIMKESRRPYRNRTPLLFDVEKREFLCPLCRFLSNCLLPLIPPLDAIGVNDGGLCLPEVRDACRQMPQQFDFETWYTYMTDFLFFMKLEMTQKNKTQARPASSHHSVVEHSSLDTTVSMDEDEILDEEEEEEQQQPQHENGGSDDEIMGEFEGIGSEEVVPGEVGEVDEDPLELDGIEWSELTTEPLRTTVLAKLEMRYPKIRLIPPMSPQAIAQSEHLFDTDIQDYLHKFCMAVGEVTTIPPVAKHFNNYLSVWLSCSYTIKSLEMLLRVMDRPLGSELSIRYSSCLRGLVRVSCVLGSIMHTVSYRPSMLNYLVDLYETLFGHKQSASFFDWDFFGILNTCLFATRRVLFCTMPTERIPKGDELDRSIVQAVFLLNVLRTLVTSACGKGSGMPNGDRTKVADDEPVSEADQQAMKNLLYLFRDFNIHYEPLTESEIMEGVHEHNQRECEDAAWERQIVRYILRDIRTQSQTLLRCCCLLFHGITDVELPKCTGDIQQDFSLMVTYLGIEADPLSYFRPHAASLHFMSDLAMCNLEQINRMRNARDEQLLAGAMFLRPGGPPVRQLIDLPDDYSDLINSVSLFMCPNNIRDDSRNPTMCLVCGEILCSQSFCCQKELDKSLVGSCTYHTYECGAGIGIFLRVRDAEILLLGINKGCFVPAPYLDAYGETDQGLRRGNPLRLCKERYRKLHLTWLSHGLHEEITRRSEVQQTLFATQWQNL
ncbi:E3 ubiquitin-protein ligase UBR1 [Anopheles cruzii]|uniref:E3 ubiquitin-protein ligase UBR1 n=1 Tax=Anopheles cruzii TaxID=68878 RepID=UPI0022EC60E3|nr:E3 ubiquitin-protein ligase UBR1 [Anopheles cruzii]